MLHIYSFIQVDDLNVLDEIAQSVSGFSLEKEFNMAFLAKKTTDTKSMIMKWGQDLKEVDKFVRLILDLHRSIPNEVTVKTSTANDDLKTLIRHLKKIFS